MSAIARDFIPKKVGRVHVVVDAAPVCKKRFKKSDACDRPRPFSQAYAVKRAFAFLLFNSFL